MDMSQITETTKNLRLGIYVTQPDRSSHYKATTNLHICDNISYYLNGPSFAKKAALPYAINFTPLDKNFEMGDHTEISWEIHEHMKKRAQMASLIVDHSMFMSSPAWYMFYPMLKSQELQDLYKVTMKLDKDIQKSLQKQYFKSYHYYQSLLYFMHMSYGVEMTFCNIKNCTVNHIKKNQDNTSNKIELYSRDKFDYALDLAMNWGINPEHK